MLLGLIPFAVMVLAFQVAPILSMLMGSFSKSGGSGFTFKQYDKILHSAFYLQAIKNSFLISAYSSIVGIIIGLLCAYSITRFSPRSSTAADAFEYDFQLRGSAACIRLYYPFGQQRGVSRCPTAPWAPAAGTASSPMPPSRSSPVAWPRRPRSRRTGRRVRTQWRSRPWGQIAILGALIATAASFAPAVVPLTIAMALAWTVGSLLVGGADPGWRVLVVAGEAVIVTLVLAAPWAIGTALAGKGAVAIFGLPVSGAAAPNWGEVIRFAIGPAARSPIVWLLVAGAALPLLLGRGVKLTWAARLWVTACASWGLAFAATRGDLGSFTPSESVVLAPAALAVAACVGLGISAFEDDLTGREFGWRQVVSVVALVFVAAGLLPVAVGAADGRWDLPSQGVEQPLAFLTHAGTSGVGRVLWLGDPRSLPAGGWSVQPGLAYACRRRRTCRMRRRCSPLPALGRPCSWPMPSAWPSPAGRCTSAGCSRRPGCGTWWSSTAWPRPWWAPCRRQ